MSLHGPIEVVSGVRLWLHFSGDTDAHVGHDLNAAHLTENDVRRAERYRSIGKRRQFLISRKVIFDVVNRELNGMREYFPWRIASHVQSGRPELRDSAGGKIRSISISHSGNLTAIAFSNPEVDIGVDVEVCDQVLNPDSIARIPLTPYEAEWHGQLSGMTRTDAIRQSWTIKEAVWKSVGKESAIEMYQLTTEPTGRQRVAIGRKTGCDYCEERTVQCFGGAEGRYFPGTAYPPVADPEYREFCGAVAVSTLCRGTAVAW